MKNIVVGRNLYVVRYGYSQVYIQRWAFIGGHSEVGIQTWAFIGGLSDVGIQRWVFRGGY